LVYFEVRKANGIYLRLAPEHIKLLF